MMDKFESKNLRITVLGLGYIGLPTALTFADAGFTVYGFDVNPKVIESLSNEEAHIVEPELSDLLQKTLASGKFIPVNTILESDVFIVCVPTPFIESIEEKKADLSYVESAGKIIAQHIRKGNLVILESTVPPGATENVLGKTIEKYSSLRMHEDFLLAYCPERVLPGNILYELKNNDRIVGVADQKTGEIVKALYESILDKGKVYITNIMTVEMCKLVENAYRDVNIAFANEVSMIADQLGIDVFELIELANKHPRVNILQPGVGVGGHCIAVDPWFIVEKFPQTSRLIRTAREVNDSKPYWVAQKVEEAVAYDRSKIIGILGLAYKANVGDLRESPSIKLAHILQTRGYEVLGCEPHVKLDEIEGIPNIPLEEIVKKSDILVLTLAHDIFLKNIQTITSKNVIDVVGATRKV